MRAERRDGVWELVDGWGAAAPRWRLESDGRVLWRSPSGREREVDAEEVPITVAVALLAMREAAAFAGAHPGETICGPAALDRWPAASRHALLRERIAPGDRIASWRTFRWMFEAVVIDSTAARR
jgi:hypothetical protein